MAITQYRDRNWLSPRGDFDQVTSHLNRLFGHRGLEDTGGTSWLPAVNIEETKDELLLTAELPGLTHEDVEIELENNVLAVRGRKEARVESEDRRYHVRERRSGSFQRSFSLPRTVSANDISATFENGVLQIHLPKAAEAKGRTIEIRTP